MSAYLSRRGLDETRQGLSTRDVAIIRSVREHRFLAAGQIEELHFAEHSSVEGGARVCRRVLARLTRDRVLVRLERRVGGVRAGSASFIYALGPIGSRLLGGNRRRFTEPSSLFLDHTLAVAEAHVDLIRASRRGQLELVSVQIEPDCWRRYLGANGVLETVKPDLYAVTASGAFEDCWFLEIDRGTESPAAISRKCRAYHAYWRSGREQQAQRTFPLVAWIVPSVRRSTRLDAAIAATTNVNRDLFRVTTFDRLSELVGGRGTG